MSISPATIEAAKIQKARTPKKTLRRTKPGTLLIHHIPIKTDSWNVKISGFTETDLVSHSGNSAAGEFIHSLNVPDIHSTWVEPEPSWAKMQIAVLSAMKSNRLAPFKLLGIDSELRIFQNLFLPSMKLLDKTRIGSKLKRRYDKAKTTLERLLNCPRPSPKDPRT